MISRFFIDRPIFATVISIIVTLAGGIAVFSLPVAQYPEITPPTVQVACQYPGASAEVIADTVAAPIEQQVNGIENMLYMSSQSGNDGSYTLTITFELGTDLDAAMVTVQQRVALAMPQLPSVVQTVGVDVRKKSSNMLLVINFVSPDGRYDDLYMSNYATINVKDELARLEGVGDMRFLGQRDYSMRVWLNPDLMAARDIPAAEVVRAIQQQNMQINSGQLGQQPGVAGEAFQLTTSAEGQLTMAKQFGDIIVKTAYDSASPEGPRVVRLRDVGRVDLEAKSYGLSCTLDGKPSVAIGVYQRPGANALTTGKAIRGKMEELKRDFPEGLDYEIVFDTTPFVAESITQVFHGLRDAIILVALVVLVFLQNWRAALIPLLTVPVAIVGTFAFMIAIGFSLNTLSLFGLVLAIGIVVDDAIVVVENVQRFLEQGYSPREAAQRAMDEVTAPVIAVALVLSAVFLPCIFVPGITGEFLRQFAVTVSVSMALSALNSLTLSPALAALLLKPKSARRDPLTVLLEFLLGWFFWLFNRGFAASTNFYIWLVRGMVRIGVIVLLVYAGLLYLTYWTFANAPEGFIPLQDKGWLLVNVELPDSASEQRTAEVMQRVADIAKQTPGVAHTITVTGESFVAGADASNYGSMFIILDPFEKRRSFRLNGLVIFLHLRQKYPALINDAVISVFPPPPVNGLGATGGFELVVEDRTNRGLEELQRQTNVLVEAGGSNQKLAGVMTLFRADSPELFVDIDRGKARTMGVSMADISQTLQIYLGSVYVNNFTRFGRSWQVVVQADQSFRNRAEEIAGLKVRNIHGEMVTLGSVLKVRNATGPPVVTRYNMYPAATISGRTQLGISSGEAIEIMDAAVARQAAGAMPTEWTGLSLMQIQAGDTAVYVFALAIVFVFLVLAALYESWSLPLAILMVVPLGLLFSVAGVWAFPFMNVGIFTQIGFVVLVGLASKNAILIVEFAEGLRREGRPLLEATLEASRLRLRPIIMTSAAFMLGVLPLVIGGGAGAEMRRALGVAVFCGMFGVTVFGIFMTPVFYFVVQWAADRMKGAPPWLQWITTPLISVCLGAVFGLSLWRTRSFDLHWAMIIGVSLGLLAGLCVSGAIHARRRRAAAAEQAEGGAT